MMIGLEAVVELEDVEDVYTPVNLRKDVENFGYLSSLTSSNVLVMSPQLDCILCFKNIYLWRPGFYRGRCPLHP
jgi:hypothetical protein